MITINVLQVVTVYLIIGLVSGLILHIVELINYRGLTKKEKVQRFVKNSWKIFVFSPVMFFFLMYELYLYVDKKLYKKRQVKNVVSE